MSWLGDTLAKGVGTAVSLNPLSLALAAVLPGDATRANYATGVSRLLGADGGVGGLNPSTGTYNPSMGDAARSTLDYFTPDYVYTAPPELGQRGTQRGSSPLLDDVREAAPKLMLAVAVLGAALVVSRA